MTADASLPPADVQRPTPFTDEELAAITDDHFGFCDVCRYSERTWCQTGRLITDLRASRERIRELEESITHCSGSCAL